MIWIEFLISSAIIVYAGTTLARCADTISEHFNFNKVWIGVILLGFVTSLPEAATSLAAAASLQAADLAIGNIAGSVNFNLMIIVILDCLYRRDSITNTINANWSHIFSAACAALLTSIVFVEIFIRSSVAFPVAGGIGIGSVMIAVVYLLGIRILSRMKSNNTGSATERSADTTGVMRIVMVKLGISIVVVLASAYWIAHVAEQIADTTHLGRTFVGSVFLGFSTSLPEIVVSISALRLGSLDLAFGNIFGSNMINMFILFLCDVVYRRGAIFSAASPSHLLTLMMSIILTGIVILGIHRKKKILFFGLGYDTVLMSFLFLAGMGFLYQIR